VFNRIEIRSTCAKTEILLIFLQCASDFSRDSREHFLLLIEAWRVCGAGIYPGLRLTVRRSS